MLPAALRFRRKITLCGSINCHERWPAPPMAAGFILQIRLRQRTPNHKRFRLYATYRRPMAKSLGRADTAQCIDRIFSRTSNVQQQEASHNAKIFVKAIHAVDLILAC